MAKMGAPSKYTPQLAGQICTLLGEGMSLREVCDNVKVTRATVYRWLTDKPDFRDMYAHAREEQAETMADEIVRIADEEEDPNRARVRIDARKWVAAKLKPRKYGDKQQIEHTGNIQTMNLNEVDAKLTVLLGKAGIDSLAGTSGLLDTPESD